MTGLIASPASAPDPENAEVVADDWFPPVTLDAVRDALRLGDGVVTTARLVAAIEGAMIHAFRELSQWRTARILEGAGQLTDVTALTVNGRNYAEVLWERAVRHFAGAELFTQYRDVSATEAALDRAEDKDTAAEEQRRLALAAIADLLAIGGAPIGRNRVALI